jgi:hypothetical protein
VLTNLIAGHWGQRNDRYSQLRHAVTEAPGENPERK